MVKVLVTDYKEVKELKEICLVVDAGSSEELFELARELRDRGYMCRFKIQKINIEEERENNGQANRGI